MCALLDSGRNGLGEGGVGRQVNVHLKVQGSYLISLEINFFFKMDSPKCYKREKRIILPSKEL